MKPKRYFKKQHTFNKEEIGGIYFLMQGNNIVYIGRTYNVVTRLYAHSDKKWDRFRLIPCQEKDRAYYENRLIKLFKPIYNKAGLVRYGRNPIDKSEKVVLVGFYTKRSVIDSVGGMDRAREIAKNHVEARAEADEVGRLAMHG